MQSNESLGVLRLIFPSSRAGRRPVIGWKHLGGPWPLSDFYRELSSGCITDWKGSDTTWELRMSWGWYLGYFTLCHEGGIWDIALSVLRVVSVILHSLSWGWYLGYFTLCHEGGIWDISLSVTRLVFGIFHSLSRGWYLGYFTLCPEGGI